MQHEPVKIIDVDELASRVGGRFQLTSLVAKRLRALNAGAPLLVEPKAGERTFDLVCREINEGKIWLEASMEEAVAEEAADSSMDDIFDNM
ncbi:MAG: DNA-directed RNA polymerase subunit omega [Planctomycetes bacterium]|nr:DNA-directed RNA polymerase subunit omega [Planctomycetota bacterium]